MAARATDVEKARLWFPICDKDPRYAKFAKAAGFGDDIIRGRMVVSIVLFKAQGKRKRSSRKR